VVAAVIELEIEEDQHILLLRLWTFPTHRAVVLGAAIGRADDQRLAEPVAKRLQYLERSFVDQQLEDAKIGDPLNVLP
jgi:hypothetical protein